jgi:hypothetical protein
VADRAHRQADAVPLANERPDRRPSPQRKRHPQLIGRLIGNQPLHRAFLRGRQAAVCAGAAAPAAGGERVQPTGLEAMPPAQHRRPVDADGRPDFGIGPAFLAQTYRHAPLLFLGRGGQAARITRQHASR